jgi:hypothetical protein
MKPSLPVLVLLSFLLPIALSAQLREIRYEQAKKNRGEDFVVVPMEEYGALLIQEHYKKGLSGNYWNFILLDKDLKETWKQRIDIDPNWKLLAWARHREQANFIFQHGPIDAPLFTIIRANLLNGSLSYFIIQNDLEFTFHNIIALKDKIVLGGYVRESPTVLSYSFGSDRFTVLPGYFSAKGKVIALDKNSDGETFNVVSMEPKPVGQALKLRTFGVENEILFSQDIPVMDGIEILEGKTLGYINGNIAFVASYGSSMLYYTQGIFYSWITPDPEKTMVKYHPLSAFERIFDYEGPKRAEQLETRTQRKNAVGKEAKVNTLLSFRQIYNAQGNLVIFAELFHKTTAIRANRDDHTYGYSNYGGGVNAFYKANHPFISNYYRFDFDTNVADQYSVSPPSILHTAGMFSFGVNSLGEIIFDNGLPTTEKDRLSGLRLVDGTMVNDNLHFLYRFEDGMVFKSVPFTSEPIDEFLLPRTDASREEKIMKNFSSIGGVDRWFDNYFLVWGYNRIRSNEGKRNVIYIDKIAF